MMHSVKYIALFTAITTAGNLLSAPHRNQQREISHLVLQKSILQEKVKDLHNGPIFTQEGPLTEHRRTKTCKNRNQIERLKFEIKSLKEVLKKNDLYEETSFISDTLSYLGSFIGLS